MDDIVLEHVYPYSLEQVWEALTEPAALADWLMPGDFKPVVGHRVCFHCDPRAEFDGVVDVEVLEADRPRRLSYTWKTGDMRRPTTVTYTLTALPGGQTKLRLEHTGFAADNGPTTHPLFKQGWGHKLGDLLPRALASRRGESR
jgi:uncharacterized protein YndB with AHSA1/START domain